MQCRDDFLDDRVILEHDVNAGRATNRVRGTGGNVDAELLERTRLVGGTVPDGDLVAALGGGFSEGGPKEAGSEICDLCHMTKASRRHER